MRKVRNGLSAKMFGKVVFSGFFAHPARLLIAFFLSVAAFALAGSAITLSRYTEERAKEETYAQLVDLFRITSNEGKILERRPDWELALSDGGVIYVGSSFLSARMLSLPNAPEEWEARLRQYQLDHHVHVQAFITSVACFSSEAESGRKGKWLVGGYPRGESEVAFSSCFANALVAAGWLEGEETEEISSYAELAGRRLLIPFGAESREVVVSGVYDNSDCPMRVSGSFDACAKYDMADWHGALFVSEELYTGYFERYGADALYFAGDHSRETARALAAFLEKSDTYVSDVFAEVEHYRKDVNSLKTWCAGLSGALGAFAVIVLYQFISILLDDKTRIVLILRMLGARKGIAVRIAFAESAAFGGTIGVCAAGLSVAANPLINALIGRLFQIDMVVAWFSAVSIVGVVALSLLASLLAALLPAVRLTGKDMLQGLANAE